MKNTKVYYADGTTTGTIDWEEINKQIEKQKQIEENDAPEKKEMRISRFTETVSVWKEDRQTWETISFAEAFNGDFFQYNSKVSAEDFGDFIDSKYDSEEYEIEYV